MRNIITVYIRPYFRRMGVGFLIKFAGTIMDLCIPYILAYIIDTVIPAGDRLRVLEWGLGMLVCSALAVSGNIIANRRASRVAADIIKTIRHDVFARIMTLSGSQMDALTRPSLISRMTSDTYELQQVIARIQRLGVRAPILLTGGVIVTFTLDWAMALVLTALLPLLVLVTVLVSRKGIPLYAKLRESADGMVRVVREDVAGIRVIKALSKTDYETERFREVNQSMTDQDKKAGMVMAVTNPSMNILLNLGLVCVIVTGAFRVNAGTGEVGKILAFTTYFTIILNAMLSMTRMFEMISRAIASGDRVWELLAMPEELGVQEPVHEFAEAAEGSERAHEFAEAAEDLGQVHEFAKAADETGVTCKAAGVSAESKLGYESAAAGGDGVEGGKESCPPAILFDHVNFSYYTGREEQVLTDISFCVGRGEMLGIIGEIGSGKSTILNLMMRLYEADSGQIRIDGRDIRTWRPKELKQKFGVVFQNDMIFEDTIAENVTLGRPLSSQEVSDALCCAQAGEFVRARRDQQEDGLSIRGANLSGGQRQRVLIARALAARPEILILDDSSSALDYKTDASLRRAIRAYLPDTTLVVVAQRVSSILHADHILVLENGRMIGYGTHEELLEHCSVYREIAHSQMGEVR